MTGRKDPHDDKTPAKATRFGRAKGVRVFIPAAALKEAFKGRGDVPDPLFYRVIPWSKKTIVIRLGAEGQL